jgi:hypothetical protein
MCWTERSGISIKAEGVTLPKRVLTNESDSMSQHHPRLQLPTLRYSSPVKMHHHNVSALLPPPITSLLQQVLQVLTPNAIPSLHVALAKPATIYRLS